MFLVRIVAGFCIGIALGVFQVGWSERTYPLVVEYGLVVGFMAFAVTNYLEFRKRVFARVLASANPAPTAPTSPKKKRKR